MKNQLAYIDEFGTNALDFTKPNISTHFIATAIIVDAKDKDRVSDEFEKIRKKNFQTGELRSKKVGQDDKRRLRILREIEKIDFHIFSLVVDKRAINSEGLTYKKSFYKFINGILYNDLFKIYPDLQLHADEIGTSEFKVEFAKYVNSRHIPSLFTKSNFIFLKSDSNILIQASDFVSGTLGRCFDETILSPEREQFLSLLSKKILSIKVWPANYSNFKTEDIAESGKYDPTIAELGINLAAIIREQLGKSKDEVEQDQLICLNHLLFHFRYISPSKYVWRRELIENLENNTNRRITSRYFMSQIIAKLRNKGVIISSSSKGYKLPANEGDLYEFLNHSNSIIKPMIDRIKICRDSIKAATKNGLDILDKSEFEYLKKTLD